MDLQKTDDAVTRRIRAITDRVGHVKQNDLYFYNQPVEEILPGMRVRVHGREMGMYASYSYLGLVNHPRINEAARRAVDKFGTGTHGVRSLAGTLTLHTELEETIANFKHAEAAITYASGYATNLTVISTLMGRGDYVFSDKLNHASIVDGCLMSGAEFRRFRHNDMMDLEKVLASLQPDEGRMIVVDGVFSMEGDTANLPEIVRLARRYGARIYVDEAHAIGVLGNSGRGTAEHFGVENDVDIVMGTFSKSFASIGGFVAARRDVIEFIKHHSRAFVYSASLAPANAAAVLKAIEIIEREPERRHRLRELSATLRRELVGMGFRLL